MTEIVAIEAFNVTLIALLLVVRGKGFIRAVLALLVTIGLHLLTQIRWTASFSLFSHPFTEAHVRYDLTDVLLYNMI